MTYDETIVYLYNSVPVFHNSGASAYKPGLGRSLALDNHLDHPHQAYKTIHVAGTNGKGSVCHLLASIFREAGYTTGLYTSPHLVDFRERIRVNGEMISREFVVEFVEKYKSFFEPLQPSFFELTSTMAFDYFRHKEVDIAIIETGLGGRLDSTNIISPELSIITNISPDHKQFLGETCLQIAAEKAGIIKPCIPVLIGEVHTPEIKDLFTRKAGEVNAPVWFADDMDLLDSASRTAAGQWRYNTTDYGKLSGELRGEAQLRNTRTVLGALRLLREKNIMVTPIAASNGFAYVTELTGLRGRWEIVHRQPVVVCDTGHNEGAWEYLTQQLMQEMVKKQRLFMVIGMANDKDVQPILRLMPDNACYYFTQASVSRAMPAGELMGYATASGKKGILFPTVQKAVRAALEEATPEDMIFIGGSTFVVADALPIFDQK